MILEVFSNLNDSMIPQFKVPGTNRGSSPTRSPASFARQRPTFLLKEEWSVPETLL